MKREGYVIQRAADPENLRQAFWRAQRGKKDRPEVIAFRDHLDEELSAMRKGLIKGGLVLGRQTVFGIRDPKPRLICAPAFPERVLHHALVAVVEVNLEKFAIDDSYACRPGKGSHRAVLRAQSFSRKSRSYLKLDIARFFDSISHDLLLKFLARRFKDQDFLGLVSEILGHHQVSRARGLAIGSLMSQHLANFFLGYLDRFVKEELRCQHYLRYMDDFVLWHDQSSELRMYLRRIREYLSERLQLDLKDSVLIGDSARGMDFLGFRIWPQRLGLGRRARYRFSRELSKVQRDLERQSITEDEASRKFDGLWGWCRMAETAGIRSRVLARYS